MAALIPPSWLSFQADRLGRTVGFYRPLPGDEESFQGLYPPDHTERIRRVFVSLFNPLITWLTTLVLVFWSRRLFADDLQSFLLPSVFLLATIAWPYSKPFYTEPLATFWLLLAAWTADRIKPFPCNHPVPDPVPSPCQCRAILCIAGVGIFAGLAVLTRLDSVVACPGLAVIVIGRLLQPKMKHPISLVTTASSTGLLAFAFVVSFQLLLNQMHYGSPLATGYSDQPEGIKFSIPVLTALWIYLISPGKGIFWYSPPLLAALLVWPTWWHRDKGLAIGTGLIVLGYLFVVGRWQNLGGWCWGPRHLVQLTPFLLLPLPLLLDTKRDYPKKQFSLIILVFTCLPGIIIQFFGILVDFMWPLDQTMRGLPPGEDTARALSFPYYGPVLHLWSWKFDPDPDWFLCDLWRSGRTGARLISGGIWCLWIFLLGILLKRCYQATRLATKNEIRANIGNVNKV